MPIEHVLKVTHGVWYSGKHRTRPASFGTREVSYTRVVVNLNTPISSFFCCYWRHISYDTRLICFRPPPQQPFETNRVELIEAERDLMCPIQFDFNIEHPYPHVHYVTERLGMKGKRLLPHLCSTGRLADEAIWIVASLECVVVQSMHPIDQIHTASSRSGVVY